jgi:hypothetical protein
LAETSGNSNRDFQRRPLVFGLKPGAKVRASRTLLAVCHASRIKPPKIALRAIFYPANCVSSPIIVVFMAFFNEKTMKTHKCNRLLDY